MRYNKRNRKFGGAGETALEATTAREGAIRASVLVAANPWVRRWAL